MELECVAVITVRLAEETLRKDPCGVSCRPVSGGKEWTLTPGTGLHKVLIYLI